MALDLTKILQALQGGFQPIGPGPAGRRAAAEAQLRYVPALQALGLLGQQTQGQFQQEAQGVRRGGAAAAGAIGGIRSGFLDQLEGTPAPTSEAAANLGLTRDAVAGDLARMEAQARAGVPAQVQQLRSKRNSDLGTIVQQLMDTAQQGSLYNVSQFETLAQQNHENAAEQKRWMAEQKAAAADAQRSWDQWQTEQGNLMIRDGRNPATGQPDPAYADPEKPDKPKGASRSEREGFRKTFGQAYTVAQRLKDLDLTLDEAMESLSTGQPAEPVYEDQADPNNPGKTRRVRVGTTPGWKPIDDPLVIRAAVQQAYLGGVKPRVVKRIRGAGYKPRASGVDPLSEAELRRMRQAQSHFGF